MAKLNKKKILNAIDGSFGVKSVIAQRCNVSRSAITQYLQNPKNKYLLDLIEEEKSKVLDVGEKALIEAVLSGDVPAIKFLLSTKGKHRGYIEKTEQVVEHKGEGIKIIIEEKDEK